MLFCWFLLFISPNVHHYANFWGKKLFLILYYPWTKRRGKHFWKFQCLVTFYNMFHKYERKRNPWSRNTKVWKICENFALFQQVYIGLQKLITFETTLPWRIGLILNKFIFDLKIIDIELPLLITIRNFIIKISRVI